MTFHRYSVRTLPLLFACLSLGVLGAAADDQQPRDVSQRDALRDLARGNNQFAWELYQQLRSEKGNLFLSPYSISTALAMTFTGARGMTAEEMAKILHLSGATARVASQFQQLQTHLLDQARGYELRIANALWGQVAHPFKRDFLAGLQQQFRAEGRTLDFARDPEGSRATINRWVEEATREKIKELLPSGIITGQTRMVLTNAIYFKGQWVTKFDKAMTQPEDFTSGNDSFKTDMMRRTGEMLYAEDDAMQMIEMPYQGNRLTMVVLLPRKKDGLGDLEAALTAERLDTLIRSQQSRRVDVHLPRSKTTASFKLKPTLTAMGMRAAFNGQGDADFSGIDGTRELFIDEVVHKAYCEVNEEGTEAAAATGVVVKALPSPVPQQPVEFRADHPYLYMIRDTQTGSLLFLGRMTDPR